MENIGKIAALAVTAALCAVVVRRHAPELGLILALTAGAVILAYSVTALTGITEMMQTLADTAGLSPAVLKPMVKTVGVGILTRLTAEVCRDAKENAIAAFVETAGACAALLLCLPLMESVLSMVEQLM
ncbi:MAG: stage III sporulation AC/AD family protein [Oscillospiraceae bacterium]|nr:stage III sporulation AC/AD family protein [Oscillospiraceae bacterium]